MSSKTMIVQLEVDGVTCWHELRVSNAKLPLLKRLQAGEAVDVTALGTIIASGWGEPPAAVNHDLIDA